jgi:hypothetical protein
VNLLTVFLIVRGSNSTNTNTGRLVFFSERRQIDLERWRVERAGELVHLTVGLYQMYTLVDMKVNEKKR